MKNLLTKILFVSLLLSAVIPSGVQADSFFAENCKEFAKTLGAVGGGMGVGAAVGSMVKKRGTGLAVELTVGVIVGSGMGIATLKTIQKRRTGEIITAGIGGSLGVVLALSITEKLSLENVILVTLIGGTVGATLLEQIGKNITL